MEHQENWGLTLSLDLYDCDELLITSRPHISNYAIEICEVINMRRYGEPLIEWFGREEKVKGFTLVQLIETSSITAHFAQQKKAAYIDIFSCKLFDVNSALNFTFDFFKAKNSMFSLLHRK